MADAPTKPIDVTILSGFLGSGKTTLLCHLLASQQKDRVAVLALSIDDTPEDAKKHLEKKGWSQTTNLWSGDGGLPPASMLRCTTSMYCPYHSGRPVPNAAMMPPNTSR